MFDAVVLGLGSMIGAGVFAALAPAARAAGNGLLLSLLLAAFVAYCNATSSAALAALYPESGGTYVYGQKRLGPFWGFLAGFGFVVGKLASSAAMALTFASYVAPSIARPLAAGAVLLLTAVNYHGVRKTAFVTRAIVACVLASLAAAVIGALGGGQVQSSRLWPLDHTTPYGLIQAAGFLFFAFAGYARIATLGEEVIDPARTIPRAIPRALGLTLLVYALVAVSVLLAIGAAGLASSTAPLASAVRAGKLHWLAPAVQLGAAVASLGVLLSLMAGVARTVFAMAANGDLPRYLAAVHPLHRIPHRAELGVGLLAAALTAIGDIGAAIGFSSFGVLVYYAIANASALSLTASERRWPRWISGAGLVGCAVLLVALPLGSIAGGAAVLLVGALSFWLHRR